MPPVRITLTLSTLVEYQSAGHSPTPTSTAPEKLGNSNATDALDAVSTQPRSVAMNPYNSTVFQSVVPTHTLATVPDDLEVLLVPGGLGTRAPDLNATID